MSNTQPYKNKHHQNVINIEAIVRNNCLLSQDDIKYSVNKYLESTFPLFQDSFVLIQENNEYIGSIIESIRISDVGTHRKVSFWQAKLNIYCYRINEQVSDRDYLEGEGEELPAMEVWELPNRHLEGLWESIILDSDQKSHIIGYTSSSILFSESKLDSTIINWNRMILLHGKSKYASFLFGYAYQIVICW